MNGEKVPFMGLSRDLTGPYNFVGFPAISVPSGFSKKEELPMAIQIVGMPYQEAHILRIANSYESATPEIRNILSRIRWINTISNIVHWHIHSNNFLLRFEKS